MLILNFFTETIGKAIVSLLLLLDSFIYSLVDWTYQIILILANTNILQNTTTVSDLIKRMYVILGVIMMFLIAYSLLKGMVNPNEALKDKKSPVNLIKNVIISIVLIALVPTIFDFAYGFQNALLTENTIGKIILGSTSSEITNENGEATSASEVLASGGREMAAGVLQAFLHPDYASDKCTNNNDGTYNCEEGIEVPVEEIGFEDIEKVGYNTFWNDYVIGDSLLNITALNDNIAEGEVTYIFILSTIGGIVIMLVLLMYCFDIAIRAVKLSVFEIIAPITILARLIPGEQGKKTFDNWVKACLSTFVEVFIRLALLFFAILIIKIVIQNFPNYFNAITQGRGSNFGNIVLRLFAQAFIIIGIVLFLRQAPQIIKDITGLDSGKFNPLKSALGAAALLGGSAQAFANRLNATDDNGNKLPRKRRILSAFGGAASAGLHAFRNLDNVKDRKSMNEARKNAAKHAAERKAQKDNREAEKERYLKEINEERVQEGKSELKGVRGALKYKVGVGKEKLLEWAGVTGYDSTKADRLIQASSEFNKLYDNSVDAYKEKAEYKDANSVSKEAKSRRTVLSREFDALQQEFQSHLQQIYADNGITAASSQRDKDAAQQLAMETFNKRTEYETKRTELQQANRDLQIADQRVEDIKFDEHKKKATSIVADMKTALDNIESKYADVAPALNDIENRIRASKSQAEADELMNAFNMFGNIHKDSSQETIFRDALRDVNNSQHQMAEAFLDFMDEYKKEFSDRKASATYEKGKRESSFGNSNKSGDSN